MKSLLLLMFAFLALYSQITTVEYYTVPEPAKSVLTSRSNMKYSLWPPSKKSFDSFIHNSVIRQEAVKLAIDNPMLSPNTALLSAMYHDYVENNATSEVFELYEYAAYNEGLIGKRRAYLAFADFLIRTKTIHILERTLIRIHAIKINRFALTIGLLLNI